VVYKSLGEGNHVLRVGQVVPLRVIEAKQPLDTHTLFGQVVGSKYIVQVYFTDIYDGMALLKNHSIFSRYFLVFFPVFFPSVLFYVVPISIAFFFFHSICIFEFYFVFHFILFL
jgi:hypothetical protein